MEQLCRMSKLIAKLRRRDRDQLARPLGEIATVQIRNAILGDNVMDMRPRSGHSSTRRQ
jgi:hypothetical protein